MNTSNKDQSPEGFEEAYVLAKGIQGFQQTSSAPKPILFNDIYQYVMGHISGDQQAQRVEKAIGSNITLRRHYNQLLNASSKLTMSEAVEASSDDEINERSCEGFTLKIRHSNTDEQQAYVIIELDKHTPFENSESLTIHVCSADEVASEKFPAPHDLKAHIMLSKESQFVRLIRTGNTKISLL